jgi:hypothetical protein
LFCLNSSAAILYVDVNNPTPIQPYTNWATAATVIQDAIVVAQSGDEVLVTNGVYAVGGAQLFITGSATNRVALTNPITVASVNGPTVTTIDGKVSSRCSFIISNAVLSGFTLTNGLVGAYCELGAVVTNCIIVGCRAGGVQSGTALDCFIADNVSSPQGAGAFNSILDHCVVSNNVARGSGSTAWGGGASFCTLSNCLLIQNRAYIGGGAYQCTLYNCTVSQNFATNQAGGLANCSAYNTIVYGNSALQYPEYNSGLMLNSWPSIGLTGTNGPGFMDASAFDFRLTADSPCINSGKNSYNAAPTDLDGNPRVTGGTVDVGAFEYQSPASLISYAWLQQYGFATDGSADFLDADKDGMNNWQEWLAATNPTNRFSVLLMSSVSNNATGVDLSWQSTVGTTYLLVRASSLEPLSFSVVQSNILSQGRITSYTDTNPPVSGPAFYRVGVQQE